MPEPPAAFSALATNDIDALGAAQHRQRLLKEVDSGRANDVANEKNAAWNRHQGVKGRRA